MLRFASIHFKFVIVIRIVHSKMMKIHRYVLGAGIRVLRQTFHAAVSG
jgi:hypothetical protein